MATTAAFEGGGPWLDALLEEIEGNARLVQAALAPFPGVTVSPLEGTYLLWVDLGGAVPQETLRVFVLDRCHIAPDFGAWFYPDRKDPCAHIRLNLAAPRQTIQWATARLTEALRGVLESA